MAASARAATVTGRVLVITNDFPPRRGGIESFVASLCSGLPVNDLVVYTATMAGSTAVDAGLDYPVIRDRSRQLLPTPRVARAVQRVARAHDCDRVVFGAAAPLGMLASALRGSGVRRLVALTHGHEVWWAKTPPTRRLLHRIGEDVDVVTYVSEYCRAEIAPALSSTARRRMVRLSPGVNTARFRPGLGRADAREAMGIGPRQPVVLAAGRLVRRKGHDMLIQAWPRVLRAVPDALLLVVGDGPGSRRLQALASRLGVADAVRHLGGVSWEQMPHMYTASDVFALPCRTRLRGLEPEAFGIVFLEAAAAGLPVIVGESGGAPETLVNGETGYLVDPLDLGQIADRIISLLISPGQAGAMGAAGRARVTKLWPESRAVATLKELLS